MDDPYYDDILTERLMDEMRCLRQELENKKNECERKNRLLEQRAGRYAALHNRHTEMKEQARKALAALSRIFPGSSET